MKMLIAGGIAIGIAIGLALFVLATDIAILYA
jgi:hypothetical protein